MTASPLTISPEETCDRALAIMDGAAIDHLPVCSGRRLVGLLKRSVIRERIAALVGPAATAREIEEFLPLVRVSGVMRRAPATVAPSTPVADAARLLSSECLTALPVVDEEGLVGILTVHDLLLSIVDGGFDGAAPACSAC